MARLWLAPGRKGRRTSARIAPLALPPSDEPPAAGHLAPKNGAAVQKLFERQRLRPARGRLFQQRHSDPTRW